MNHVAILFFAVLTALAASCSPSTTSQFTTGPASFADDRIEVPVPAGATMENIPGESSYHLTLGGEMYYLQLNGPAESEENCRKRTEASREEIFSMKGKPAADGSKTVTITDVSDVLRHDVEGEPVFAFRFSADTDAGGVVGSDYATMGFGSVGGASILFRHTGQDTAAHPDSMIRFLNTVTFKRS